MSSYYLPLTLRAHHPPDEPETLREKNYLGHPAHDLIERLLDLNEALTLAYYSRGSFPDIDVPQFRRDINEFWELQHDREYHICLISSCSGDWLPFRVIYLVEWIVGGCKKYPIIPSLGIICAKFGRSDLLKILAEVGDEKARPYKTRTKLPKEMSGKQLTFTKLGDDTWLVETGEPDRRSFYQRLLDERRRLVCV